MVRDFAQQNRVKFLEVLGWLPDADRAICERYFVEELTQKVVSYVMGIGQPEVSGRLRSFIKLLPFLLNRPTRDPIRLRNDLSKLLPERLFRPAHALYLNISTRRTADILEVSERTAGNLRREVVAHLEELAGLPGNGPYDHAALADLGLVDAAGAVLADDEVTTRRELAARYLADFGRAKPVSARFTRPFRKNEAVRANALMEGEPIDGSPLHKTKSEKPAG